MPKDDHMRETGAFLPGHPDIEATDLLMPGMCGILRGKRLARDSLDKLFAGAPSSGLPHVDAPVVDLPVRKAIGELPFVADLTPPYGRVMHDYLS